MARLPSLEWLVQDNPFGMVQVFREGDEKIVVEYDGRDANATAKAQKVIHDNPDLTDEDKSFAHFWCGYFRALHCLDLEG